MRRRREREQRSMVISLSRIRAFLCRRFGIHHWAYLFRGISHPTEPVTLWRECRYCWLKHQWTGAGPEEGWKHP